MRIADRRLGVQSKKPSRVHSRSRVAGNAHRKAAAGCESGRHIVKDTSRVKPAQKWNVCPGNASTIGVRVHQVSDHPIDEANSLPCSLRQVNKWPLSMYQVLRIWAIAHIHRDWTKTKPISPSPHSAKNPHDGKPRITTNYKTLIHRREDRTLTFTAQPPWKPSTGQTLPYPQSNSSN
jgi:hypothetical protein